jgi:hypothetical protein
MAARIYRFRTRKAKDHASAGEPKTPTADPRDLHTLAEEARRLSIMRTCRIIARRERRGGDRGPGRLA